MSFVKFSWYGIIKDLKVRKVLKYEGIFLSLFKYIFLEGYWNYLILNKKS